MLRPNAAVERHGAVHAPACIALLITALTQPQTVEKAWVSAPDERGLRGLRRTARKRPTDQRPPQAHVRIKAS